MLTCSAAASPQALGMSGEDAVLKLRRAPSASGSKAGGYANPNEIDVSQQKKEEQGWFAMCCAPRPMPSAA